VTNTWVIPALIGAAVVGLLAIPAWLGQRSMNSERRGLLEGGAVAEAEILGYEETPDGLLVVYSFTPLEAQRPVTCRKMIGASEQRLGVGTLAEVRYKPSHPTISLLVQHARTQLPAS
jgi:hypothetical protein